MRSVLAPALFLLAVALIVPGVPAGVRPGDAVDLQQNRESGPGNSPSPPASPRPEVQQKIDQAISMQRDPGLFSTAIPDGGGGEGSLPLPPSVTLAVDCDAGGSINQALSRALAQNVIIAVSGTCRENVEVLRPWVTITTIGPTRAVIDPPDDGMGEPLFPAIHAESAHGLTLENLTLTGATDGLQAFNSRQITISDLEIVDNRDYGVYLHASEAEISASILSRNATPLLAYRFSTAVAKSTQMLDNTYDGPWAWYHSTLDLDNCQIQNNPWGPQALNNSHTRVLNSTIGVWPSGGMFAVQHSTLYVLDSSQIGGYLWADMMGIVQFYDSHHEGTWGWADDSSLLDTARSTHTGRLYASDASTLQFRGSTTWGEFIYVYDGAFFDASTLSGPAGIFTDLFLDGFSDAKMQTGEPMQGILRCTGRSRAICSPEPTGGTQDCE